MELSPRYGTGTTRVARPLFWLTLPWLAPWLALSRLALITTVWGGLVAHGIMSGVAEENESPDPRSAPARNKPDTDIVDAEVVESDPATRASPAAVVSADAASTDPADMRPSPGNPAGVSPSAGGPSGAESDDAAAFRDYQQFLQFREWQRQQGNAPGGPTAAPQPTAAKPWWKRTLGLLRYKFVRRVLYALIVLLLLNWTYNSYFGSNDEHADQGGTPGNQNPGTSPVLSSDPKTAIITLYDLVGTKPHSVCTLFDEAGKKQFAADFGAPDCPAAANQLHARVTEPMLFKKPGFSEDAVQIAGGKAAVYSCRMTVDGGPRLGAFGLHQDPKGGWVIDGHENEPADCTTG